MFEVGKGLVRNYYTEEAIRQRELEEECRVEPTPEEKKEMEASYQKLMEKAVEYDKKKKHVISNDKTFEFEMMVIEINQMAKEEHYNITISKIADNTIGKIELTTGSMCFESDMNKENRLMLLRAIMKADSVWIEAETVEIGGIDTNVIKTSLFYHLYDVVIK